MDWTARNCDRCWKGYKGDADKRSLCSLEKALSLACVGDGTISAEVATRIGYSDPLAYTWGCPEREEKRPARKPAPIPPDQGRLL
jgi:hypothetical protein